MLQLTEKDGAAVALLYDAYATEFAVYTPTGLHGPLYRLGADRLYVVGITMGKSQDGTEYQTLVFGAEPISGEKLPDIPMGCEPRKCVFAVLRRLLQGCAEDEYPFSFEALKLEERMGYALVFALTGIRARYADACSRAHVNRAPST